MSNVFDPAKHKVVAVDEGGQHIHVTLAELRADMAALPAVETVADDRPIPSINDGGRALSAMVSPTDRLAIAVGLATYAIICGSQAGDYKWHGGQTDFEFNGVRMDAPALIEYAKAQL
jgi:hypothetical protein